MAYSDKVLDHYENPRNVGSFEKGDEAIGTGMVGAPACGDVMKLQIKVGPDGRIEDARFKTYGCGSAIASSSLVTEWVKGKTLDQAVTIKNTQIAQELSLPPVKCAWACAPRAAPAWPTSSSSPTLSTRTTCSSTATASRW
ncbi:MAG: Fe-S cluster assembly scaffold IscU [Burkholderiales bacterium]|nr:Fe-S cluster assembly scaffold IscU [Burkholderiales bacterium]